MDHPHIARLVNVYETPKTLSLVMECCEGGELFDRLKDVKRLPEPEAAHVTQQMLLAVHYLHSHGIAHRDLKLENFLFDQRGGNLLKLIDFGFSRFCDQTGPPRLRRMRTACGTLNYAAPEVLVDTYTNQCDLWSLGVIVFIIVSGAMPFKGSSSSMRDKIVAGDFIMRKEHWARISDTCKHFITSLLIVEPEVRLTAKQALGHTWLQDNVKRSSVQFDHSHSLLAALQAYKATPKFRRCCFLAMTWLLTSRETAQMQKEFLAIDTDQQGTISQSELKELLARTFGVADADAIEVFKAMDANHDDEIHYSEFLAAMLSTRIDLHDNLLDNTFRNFDKDLSGYITADNLRESLGCTFEGESVETLLGEADLLEDGRISFDEFVAFVCGAPLGSQSVHLSYLPKSGNEVGSDVSAAGPKCCAIM
jgi:calcium-dependent protein kinase